MIKDEFFPQWMEVNRKELFPMVVMATMSSGKSTLINALLGQDLLPCENKACTSTKITILDDDNQGLIQAYVTFNNGETILISEDIEKSLEEYNRDEKVKEIFIRGHVNGVLNTDKALLIIDTPGPNNSRDLNHQNVLKTTMDGVDEGIVLYVLNATQFGINDDRMLLEDLRIYCEKNKNVKVLFIINKIDQLDSEKGESIEKIMTDVVDYLESVSFKNADIIPVSALSACVFKKALASKTLTRREKLIFDSSYEIFGADKNDLRSYAYVGDKNQLKFIEINGTNYRIGEIYQSIEKTGIKAIEDYIQRSQIESSKIINDEIIAVRRKK